VKKAAAALLVLWILVGCAKHGDEDFPPLLPISEPPVPSAFTVTPANGNTATDLAWSISDGSLVDYYQIYLVDFLFGATPLDTTSATSYQAPFPPLGLVFGVSTVTIQNVESRIVSASAPLP
jgi:hypothetical protein